MQINNTGGNVHMHLPEKSQISKTLSLVVWLMNTNAVQTQASLILTMVCSQASMEW